VDPKNRDYGVPHPGTFIVNRRGVVTARFFEDAYQERYTAATILAAQGVDSGGPRATVSTNHLSMIASITDASAAPGERLSIVVQATPHPRMHVYAPGKHGYRTVQLTIDPQPWLRAHETRYPPSQIYHFEPLDERVEVYGNPFRLSRDVTILATPEIQKSLAAAASVTITGALEYQACDDKICYNPARAPFSFTLTVKPLDRRPAGQPRS
jgi:DsbC/DsbD-like thiol-disulfide interchange protein